MNKTTKDFQTMKKIALKNIKFILPFDESYIKVSTDNKSWNLMDSEGKLISKTWFNEISKNNDGSIETIIENKKINYISVDSLKFIETNIKNIIPMEVFNYVEASSIEPINSNRYIAKAKLLNLTVYINKNGDLFDENDEKLIFDVDTVSVIRLNNVLKNFNKKMNKNVKLQNGDDYDASYDTLFKNKIAAYSFFWLNETTIARIGDVNDSFIRIGSNRWTNDLVVRIVEDQVNDEIIETIKNADVCLVYDSFDKFDHKIYTFRFDLSNINAVVDLFNEI